MNWLLGLFGGNRDRTPTTSAHRAAPHVVPGRGGEKDQGDSLPTLRCAGCGRTYRIGDNAVAVAPEFAFARIGKAVVLSDGVTPDREDLVSAVSASDARETARPSWEIIEKGLASGQRRRWRCGACNRINDYSFQLPADSASEPRRPETVESGTTAPTEAKATKRVAEVDREVYGGFTALHIAANKGQIAPMRQLIAEGANVRAKHPSSGDTPLHGAAKNGHKEAVELLIAKGADVNAGGIHGKTSLHQTTDTEIAEVLIASGADVQAKDDYGETPLSHAFSYHGIGKSAEIIELLISRGADVQSRDSYGRTLLHAIAGHYYDPPRDIMELAIAKGAEVNAADHNGWTALHVACYSRSKMEQAEFLISKGADVNAKNKDGNTALHLAACEGGESTVKLLLAKGANVSAQNSSRDTPLDLARRKCHGAIVELLEKK